MNFSLIHAKNAATLNTSVPERGYGCLVKALEVTMVLCLNHA